MSSATSIHTHALNARKYTHEYGGGAIRLRPFVGSSRFHLVVYMPLQNAPLMLVMR